MDSDRALHGPLRELDQMDKYEDNVYEKTLNYAYVHNKMSEIGEKS